MVTFGLALGCTGLKDDDDRSAKDGGAADAGRGGKGGSSGADSVSGISGTSGNSGASGDSGGSGVGGSGDPNCAPAVFDESSFDQACFQ
jgi:mannan endo-1,4-beta-mannosidase